MRALFEIKMYHSRRQYICRIKDRENGDKVTEGKSENPAEAVKLAMQQMGDERPRYIQHDDPANWDDDRRVDD